MGEEESSSEKREEGKKIKGKRQRRTDGEAKKRE